MPLTLSRRENEKICIGNDVVIRVVKIKGNQVRLEIDAPDNMVILRAELIQPSEEAHDPNPRH